MLEKTEMTAKRRFYVEEAILILLLTLTLVGVWITDIPGRWVWLTG